ncbi:hypothetical protein T10_7324 [Trichinella papuae]|uniref:Uncharacterized protein n=1 Tax=Trichinella papuae TaxID=268474 RepID=A0A0V1MH27_9BILA|nr:hypothetical protein T10_7324 [Trichinella papuae]
MAVKMSGWYYFLRPSTFADLIIRGFQNRQNDKSYFQTLLCIYAPDLKIQCKVISAYEVPHHNNSDNDLIKLGG